MELSVKNITAQLDNLQISLKRFGNEEDEANYPPYFN